MDTERTEQSRMILWAGGVIALIFLVGFWSYGPLAAMLSAGGMFGFMYLIYKAVGPDI